MRIYIVLEGFEVIGGPKGIGVFGDHITVRNCVLHGCNQGLIGYGTGTGSVTVEYCEFYGNGVPTGGATQHQIYMATDEIAHPGATFRLQYCYLHDGVEGDNVKSRSERNEIYYNWIELAGTSGHGLGLFAPDPDDNDQVEITIAAYPFLKPLFPPAFQPPQAALIDTGTAGKRSVDAVIDIGAFEGSLSTIIPGSFDKRCQTVPASRVAGMAPVSVYSIDGKLVRTPSGNAAGFRIIKLNDRSGRTVSNSRLLQ